MLAGLLQFRRLQVIPLHLLDADDVGLLPSPLRQEGAGSARGSVCQYTSHCSGAQAAGCRGIQGRALWAPLAGEQCPMKK